MPLSYSELEEFYEGLVAKARKQGIVCAITSGMACVNFGVSQTTRDCDLLCSPRSISGLFQLLTKTALRGEPPKYRGNLSPPLDERWLRGGWTSHFVWSVAGAEAYLDVFGVVPRGTSHWDAELEGCYASRHTVAEMKRTNRDRDWPYVTALGAQMLEAGDARGWLHIFDEEMLRKLTHSASPPLALRKRRPVLSLAMSGDSRLRLALHAERQFWHELDSLRLRIYQKALRPYMRAVKRSAATAAPIGRQHQFRLRCAEKYLPVNPLADYGLARMIQGAKRSLTQLFNPAALEWLPEVRDHFRFPTG